MALFVAILAWREPVPFLAGRYWAEECRIFYDHAWQVGFWHAVFTSYGGYLNLPANLAGALARHLVPVAFAPRVSEAIAIAGMACPPLVLMTSSTPWLRQPAARLAAIAIVMLVPAAEEIWLNTLHVQFQLALCVALIISLDAERGRGVILHRALLLGAPLSGMPSVMLLPLLAARSWLDRAHRRERSWQLALLVLGAAIQLGLFYHGIANRQGLSPARVVATYEAKLILEPFLGMDWAAAPARALWVSLQTHSPPWPAIVIGPLASLAMLWLSAGSATAIWLLLCAGLLAVGSFCGMLAPDDAVVLPHLGARYAFVPQACVFLALLAVAAQRRRDRGGAWRRPVSACLCLWVTAMALVSIAATPDSELHGRVWRDEVATWRSTPGFKPRCWPSDDWLVVHLPEAKASGE